MTRPLVLDFDGTITTQDTTETLVQAALAWRQTEDGSGGGGDLAEAWRQVQDAYARDLAAYERSAGPAARRTGWPAERAYLDGLAAPEAASLARVRASGVLRGLAGDRERAPAAGRRDLADGRVRYRRGFERLMRAVTAAGGEEGGGGARRVYVLSVNWSASYVRGVLGPWARHVTVVANEVDPEGAVRAPAGVLPAPSSSSSSSSPPPPAALATAGDKLRAMERLEREVPGGLRGCYVGDSVTDLACLHAYGGLVMAPGPEGGGRLLETLRRIRGDVPHVSQGGVRGPDGCGADIRWVSDFDEVLEFWSR